MTNTSHHGTTARLLDDVWCRTCRHTHIATIPTTTFRCHAAPGCGFGAWGAETAARHATDWPEHIVYPVHHATIPYERPAP